MSKKSNRQRYNNKEENRIKKHKKSNYFYLNHTKEPIEIEEPLAKINKNYFKPRSINQKIYINALQDQSKFIIFGIGPAGSGKTLLATQYAIKCLQENKIEKIVLTRPAVSVEEQHGFLPGSITSKLEPWLMPILDILHEYYNISEVNRMIKEKIIAIEPLAYMRGRTFKNSFIIADEMQNSTPNQMKMILTRIGENSKMVVTGDLNQHDRTYDKNGLLDFIQKFENNDKQSRMIQICKFTNSDIQRHEVINDILRIYDAYEV